MVLASCCNGCVRVWVSWLCRLAACTAAVYMNKDDPHVLEYFSDIDQYGLVRLAVACSRPGACCVSYGSWLMDVPCSCLLLQPAKGCFGSEVRDRVSWIVAQAHRCSRIAQVMGMSRARHRNTVVEHTAWCGVKKDHKGTLRFAFRQVEQPENFPTCLATKPYPKSAVSALFKALRLMK